MPTEPATDLSPLLALPWLMPAQAQKHVTHNEALRILDVVAQLAVLDRDRTEAPLAAQEGDRHIVAPGAIGAWAGRGGSIAAFLDGAWAFFAPRPGWRAEVLAEGRAVTWDGSAWSDRVAALGVNAPTDATNRLAVAAPASLFTHDGADHRVTVNKAAAADTASLLFQSGWSGRAEMGLAGTDDFAIKVSADGGTWHTALVVDAASGAVAAPAGLSADGAAVYTRATLVGPVARSAGQNTGAAIESGTTPDGSFTRLADGTQVCTHRLTASADGAIAWTFPVPFAAPPVVTATAETTTLSVPCLDNTPTTTGAAVSLRDAAGARRADPVHLVATGRWA